MQSSSITIRAYNNIYFFIKQPSVGIKTYCNRNIIDFCVGHQNTVSLLKIMISINPKKMVDEFPNLYFHPVSSKITAITIEIFSGLSVNLVQNIIHVVEKCHFLKHVAFVLKSENTIEILAATDLINASTKCQVYKDDIEANTAAHTYSGQQNLRKSRQKLISTLKKLLL